MEGGTGRSKAAARGGTLSPPGLSRAGLGRALHSRALTYFAAVAETLSIRGAARRLNIAPSAVNRQILLLEAAIGTALFERKSRSLALTTVGEVLARHARATLGDLDAVIEEVDALQDLRTGTVRIASIDGFASGLLTSIVLGFSQAHPLIKIAVSVQPSRPTTDLVAAGEADLGFTINPPAHPAYKIAARYDLAIGAIVAPDHKLARRRKVTMAECLAFPVLRGTRPKIRAAIDRAAGRRAAESFIESNSSRFKAALVRQGGYIAFSPRLGLEQFLAEGSLVFVPLADAALAGDSFAIIAGSGGLRPAPRRFLEAAKQSFAAR